MDYAVKNNYCYSFTFLQIDGLELVEALYPLESIRKGGRFCRNYVFVVLHYFDLALCLVVVYGILPVFFRGRARGFNTISGFQFLDSWRSSTILRTSIFSFSYLGLSSPFEKFFQPTNCKFYSVKYSFSNNRRVTSGCNSVSLSYLPVLSYWLIVVIIWRILTAHGLRNYYFLDQLL